MNLAHRRANSAYVMSSAWRPGRFVDSCERQDLVGELRILAAEVMSRANLLARHARLVQARTYAVLLAFAVNTQDGLAPRFANSGRVGIPEVSLPIQSATLISKEAVESSPSRLTVSICDCRSAAAG